MTTHLLLLLLLVLSSFSLTNKEIDAQRLHPRLLATTLVDLLGLTYLYDGMGVVSQTTLSNGTTTTTYQVNTAEYSFLSQFQTLTDFCEYKCQTYYNLPCFFVFGCNIQLRNIGVIVLTPLLCLVVAVLCCSKGWWSLKCWGHYLLLFSGARLVMWCYRKIVKGKEIEDMKQQEEQRKESETNKDLEYPPFDYNYDI